MTSPELVCPGCASPRGGGIECPRCGIVYAKADARRNREPILEQPPIEPFALDAVPLAGVIRPEAAPWTANAEDEALERKLRWFAIPTAVVGAGLVTSTGMGAFLARTMFGMPLHELGHAISAWLCGVPAFPTLWFTRISEERSFVMGLLTFGGLAFWALTAYRARRWTQLGLAIALLFLALVGTFGLSNQTAHVLITFGGDAVGLLLAALAISTFDAPEESKLRQSWLRWGFLVIGAFAFADIAHVWVASRLDPANLPFGTIEGVGLSDPSKLVDEHGWSERVLVTRYLAVAACSLLAIVAVYVRGLLRGRRGDA